MVASMLVNSLLLISPLLGAPLHCDKNTVENLNALSQEDWNRSYIRTQELYDKFAVDSLESFIELTLHYYSHY